MDNNKPYYTIEINKIVAALQVVIAKRSANRRGGSKNHAIPNSKAPYAAGIGALRRAYLAAPNSPRT